MLPILLDLKFIKIYTFGVFLMLAFFWSSFMLWRNIRLTSYKEEEIFDGLFFSLFGALFLSRLVYVLTNFEKFGLDIFKFILINGYPGLSLYGALAGGSLALYLFFLAKKIPFIEAIDYFISPIFLALIFGKLGSFFSGGEVGTKTKLILSVKYVGYDGLRHLTPFYEALFFLLAFYISLKLLLEIRKERLSHGFVFYFGLWYLALTYFIFDKLKVQQIYLLGQSLNFVVSGFLLLTFSFYFIYYFRGLVFQTISSYVNKAYQGVSKKIKAGPRKGSTEAEKANRGTKKK